MTGRMARRTTHQPRASDGRRPVRAPLRTGLAGLAMLLLGACQSPGVVPRDAPRLAKVHAIVSRRDLPLGTNLRCADDGNRFLILEYRIGRTMVMWAYPDEGVQRRLQVDEAVRFDPARCTLRLPAAAATENPDGRQDPPQ